MRLFIAEKPSIGRTLATALGKGQNNDGYIKGDNWTVTWCFGHLFELANPDHYNDSWKKWSLDSLPIIPNEWQLLPKNNTKKQLRIIRGLLKQASEVVNAGDSDREGQLLVDEVIHHLGWKKQVARILLNDLSSTGVKHSIQSITSNTAYHDLSQAAEVRRRCDWLLGINLSRFYTLKLAKVSGNNQLISIGRIQTPTLSLVVARDRAISNFKPVPYFNIIAQFDQENGQSYSAKWLPPPSQADHNGRCLDQLMAESVVKNITGAKSTVIDCTTDLKKKHPPLPFALADLQLAASKSLGVGVKEVLDIAQSLYEKHKAITYPRTDCQYLGNGQVKDIQSTLSAISSASQELLELIENADISSTPRCFNDKKITAHTGIIPTQEKIQFDAMSEKEKSLYLLVAKRYIMQFYGDYEYQATKIVTACENETFVATGNILLSSGWRTLDASHQEPQKDTTMLPPVKKGQNFNCVKASMKEHMTKPDSHFTEGTLIKAMESIAKYLPDDVDIAMKTKLKETDGLGTVATRAGIIDSLKERGYLKNDGKKLISTPIGQNLIHSIPDDIKNPLLTAQWEQALTLVSEGKINPLDYMKTQQIWLINHIEKYSSISA
ncbi:MAG: DNA topoisomerase III [Candidatus Thiodiazotropha endolucinida]|nr:DNA topoisomerase III [Candidatus Thiodiazotropha taylori]MCW4225197.1 DNA topoisomerase III [Candidatus Thiodiazotropha endolucinida]MCG7886768.1 DNA topoisomerase III [Candidatus Thiodiazotropha taylori]MCG8028156.1 DNA topoisomerase III [Candidatus Thiodiazotropha taylori]MCG8030585.1 DNA topoisomerase III [Candidatus Thiodiazotropha taylori]